MCYGIDGRERYSKSPSARACKRPRCLAGGFNRAVRHCKKLKTTCHLPSPSATVPAGDENDT